MKNLVLLLACIFAVIDALKAAENYETRACNCASLNDTFMRLSSQFYPLTIKRKCAYVLQTQIFYRIEMKFNSDNV